MITVLAVLGGLGFIAVVIATLVYIFDTPARDARVRAEVEAQEAAWRIQEQTRAAIGRMLDEARQQRANRHS